MKVLVVDDDPKDLELISEVLSEGGHEVDNCRDGAKALDKVIENKYDLILIDIMMPTLSGYELAKILREKFNHALKLVYVSVVPEDEVDIEFVDGVLNKPFEKEAFLEKLNKILQI